MGFGTNLCIFENSHEYIQVIYLFLCSVLEFTHSISRLLLFTSKESESRNNQAYNR